MELQHVFVQKSNQKHGQEYSSSMREKDILEEYIGIKHVLPDPYHLYLHMDDLDSRALYVRIIVWSSGKKKVVLLGYFIRGRKNQNQDPFTITYSCKYSTKNLISYLNDWEEQGFKFTDVVVKDRIHARINAFTGNNRGDQLIRNNDDYMQLKAWLSIHPTSSFYKDNQHEKIKTLISRSFEIRLTEKIPQFTQLNDLRLGLLNEDDFDLRMDMEDEIMISMKQITKQLDQMIIDYESTLNLHQPQSRNKEIIAISNLFMSWITNTKFTSNAWAASIDDCSCDSPSDPGCIIIEFGRTIPLD
jgi:hypothetical protein